MLSGVQQGALRARAVPGADAGRPGRGVGGQEEGARGRAPPSTPPSWISGAVSDDGTLRQRVDLLALGGKVLSVIHSGPLPQGERESTTTSTCVHIISSGSCRSRVQNYTTSRFNKSTIIVPDRCFPCWPKHPSTQFATPSRSCKNVASLPFPDRCRAISSS